MLRSLTLVLLLASASTAYADSAPTVPQQVRINNQSDTVIVAACLAPAGHATCDGNKPLDLLATPIPAATDAYGDIAVPHASRGSCQYDFTVTFANGAVFRQYGVSICGMDHVDIVGAPRPVALRAA